MLAEVWHFEQYQSASILDSVFGQNLHDEATTTGKIIEPHRREFPGSNYDNMGILNHTTYHIRHYGPKEHEGLHESRAGRSV